MRETIRSPQKTFKKHWERHTRLNNSILSFFCSVK